MFRIVYLYASSPRMTISKCVWNYNQSTYHTIPPCRECSLTRNSPKWPLLLIEFQAAVKVRSHDRNGRGIKRHPSSNLVWCVSCDTGRISGPAALITAQQWRQYELERSGKLSVWWMGGNERPRIMAGIRLSEGQCPSQR